MTPATPTAVATPLPNDPAATAAAEVVPDTPDPAVAYSPKVDSGFAKAATAGSEAESEDAPPFGKKILPIIPSPGAESKLSSCPYPQDALRMAETGTVGLLVYVSPSGNVTNTRIDSSSGSPSLDQAAANCVRQFGQFAPRLAGRRAEGHWGRLKFNWSFGG
jgi:protein TonB